MVITGIIIILLSLILSFLSLRDFRGEGETNRIRSKLRQDQIKGGFVFMKNKKVKHYSSTSSSS